MSQYAGNRMHSAIGAVIAATFALAAGCGGSEPPERDVRFVTPSAADREVELSQQDPAPTDRASSAIDQDVAADQNADPAAVEQNLGDQSDQGIEVEASPDANAGADASNDTGIEIEQQ